MFEAHLGKVRPCFKRGRAGVGGAGGTRSHREVHKRARVTGAEAWARTVPVGHRATVEGWVFGDLKECPGSLFPPSLTSFLP